MTGSCPPGRLAAAGGTLALLSLCGAEAGVSPGATYYVRTDGGSATQCNGRSDTRYPGSGSAQNCAWNSPLVALPNSGTARIAGGDTLIIGSGTYRIGSQMQPVPSGSSSARTRILGKTGGSLPKLAGANGIHRVLNLEGSSHVEIGHLDVTDLSDCVFNHSNTTAKCDSGDAWARVGVYASNSRNVWLHDLDVHGLGARGFQAGALTDWTLERVRINRNGSAGWDGNVGTNGSNAGKIVMRDIEIGWNGCGERVATGEPWACWGQKSGGYGDGLGTTSTGGQWLIEDAYIHHNTSDGLDLLYMNGADSTNVALRRVHAVANAGNQVKVSGNALIENSVIVGHCTFFKGKYFMQDGDSCRAYGAALLLNLTGNDTVTVRHNTIAGEGEAQIVHKNSQSSDRVHILNNVAVGFPYFVDGSRSAFSAGKAPGTRTVSGNLAWNVSSCPEGVTCDSHDLPELTLAAFDSMWCADDSARSEDAGAPCLDRARPGQSP
ncbi:hypothetical protein [Luteimonas granuli]|uniref:Right-handed parallel beta-helix repeat-containing protein n=1 Tax=Luteimonas granuli TaxID=1176533 RepID=A0A518N1X9_9GAMM|nr:hypothetical protein [Luteimonas granuli]QDW65931.1 hypothetical protein FPZ22_02670 [Luteimonas granuli]